MYSKIFSFFYRPVSLLSSLLLLILLGNSSASFAVYCVPSHPNCGAGSNITDVSIASTTLSNTGTGCTSLNAPAYSIYPATGSTTATFIAGNNYQLSVTSDGVSIISVWIDFNQNQVFETTEWTQVTTASVANFPSVVNVIIPSTAQLGTTGMRIRSRVNGTLNSAADACTVFGSGETEDYTVNITSLSPCTAPPVGGTTQASVTAACANVPFIVSLTGSSTGSGLSYQWEVSTNGFNWQLIPGATSAGTSYTLSGTAVYFRCALTCSGSTAYSTPLYVPLNTFNNCYCTSTANFNTGSDIGRVIFGTMTNGIASPIIQNTTAIQQYTDYTAVSPSNFDQGATYPISIHQINSNNFTQAVGLVYIDYNHNGILEYPSEQTFLGYTNGNAGGNVLNGYVSIPANALTGLTRMRIILVDYGSASQASCGTYNQGETEDYSINIIPAAPCSTPPIAGQAATSNSTVCGSNPFTLSIIGGTSNSTNIFQWQYSLNNTTYIDIPFANSSIYPTTQSQSTYYRCKITCSGVSSYTLPIYVSHSPIAICYCTSSGTNNSFADIGNVTISSLNNGVASPLYSNTSSIKVYTDFTSLPATPLSIGVPEPITVTQITTSTTFATSYVMAFVDWNQDAIFASNETYYIGNTVGPTNSVSGTITIPNGATPGNTRMRIVLVQGGNSGQSACGTYTYGETEDYTVNIVQLSPCTVPPVAGFATASVSSVCAATAFNLNLSGNSTGSGQTYYWQYSTDNLNWFVYNTPVAFPNYTIPAQSASTYYRCVVNCGGFISYSVPVLVTQSAPNTCYCTSAALQNTDSDIGKVVFGNLLNGNATPVLNNSSANHTYTDFTNLAPASFEQSGQYLLNVSQITSGNTFYSTYVIAFIDFNQDGNFGAGESFLVGQTNSSGIYSVSQSITIPATAILGQTRLRIVMQENTIPVACGTYNYGETEDYLISIIPALACPPVLSAGVATSAVNSACSGVPVSVYLSGNSNVAIATYNWQYSFDNISWFNYSVPSNSSASINLTANTFVRCIMTCSGVSATSTSLYLTLLPANQCYCTSAATNGTYTDIGNVTIGSLSNGLASPISNNPNATGVYSNFTNLTPVNLEQSAMYPISVSAISSSSIFTSYVTLYIDFNQNGQFETIESYNIGSITNVAGGNVVTNYITIPATASLGITRMRVVLKENGAAGQLPCGTYTYGETEDYLVNIQTLQACVSAPIAGNAIANDTTVCAGALVQVSLINNSTMASQTYQWQSSPDNVTWTNIIGGTLPSINFTMVSIVYYRCEISCSGFTSYSTPVHILQNPGSQCYCTSAATNTADDDIGNVTFLAMNNGIGTPALNNPASSNLYTDFTSLTPQSVISGASYPISVTQINSGGFYVAHINVYVDFNKNGLFEAGAETFVLGATNSNVGGNTLTGNISIPFTALPGITRMRIVLVEGATATPSPCGTYTWGETEDYSILILQNQSCSVPPTAGISNSSAMQVCPGAPFTLFLTGNSSALGQYYQWQSSTDGITWFNIGGISLDSSFVFSQTAAAYYQCIVTCSGLNSTSAPVQVTMLQSPVCGYCTNVGGTSCPSNTKITNVTLIGTSLANSDTLCNSINGSSVSIFPFGGSTTGTIIRGNFYSISVTATQNVSKSVWIDYDQDGYFAANEYTSICSSSTWGVADTAVLNIPFGIPAGATGMRIRTRINGSPNGAGDACSFYGSGETEDYTITVDIGNGMVKNEAVEAINLYPNPANNKVSVLLSKEIEFPAKLVLSNMLGEVLSESNLNSYRTELTISDYPKGIYFVSVVSKQGSSYKKLVKE